MTLKAWKKMFAEQYDNAPGRRHSVNDGIEYIKTRQLVARARTWKRVCELLNGPWGNAAANQCHPNDL